MRVSCPHTIAASLCALTPVAGPLPAQEISITDELFPGAVAGDRGPLLTRLVDDLSGEPLDGAEVFLVAERETPIGGEFWWTHRGTSDAEGFVRIARPNGNRDWHILVVEHPRCGVATARNAHDRLVRLGRGQDVPLRIVDWLGRPAPAAKVGFCGSCGHGPDLVSATADHAGFAVLRGVDVHQDFGDLYVQHPGLHLYRRDIDWRPGDPPALVRCSHGPTQSGRVLDHLGRPVAGAFVGQGNCHRGPWARTGDDGAFTILGGLERDRPDRVVLPGGRSIWFPDNTGIGVTLRLPDLADDRAYQGPVEEPATTAPENAAPEIVRRRIVVDDAPAPPHELRAWWPGREKGLRDETDDGLALPSRTAFVLTVSIGPAGARQHRDVPFPAGSPDEGPVHVRWLPAPCVTGTCVDSEGRPRAGRVRWQGDAGEGIATSDTGEFILPASRSTTGIEGWNAIELRPDDASSWTRQPVRLDGAGSPDVELGRIDIVSSPFVLVAADGTSLANARAGFARAGWTAPGRTFALPLSDDGRCLGGAVQAGDTIVIEREDHVPFRSVLRGPGPWRIEVPNGRVALEIVDATGEPVTATVLMDDHVTVAKNGRVTLRGVRPGTHRLYVGAPGHRSAIVVMESSTVDPVPLRVALPHR